MILFGLALCVILAVATLVWRTHVSWTNDISTRIHKLKDSASHEASYVDLTELGQLPVIVQKYFNLVLQDGLPLINQVVVTQRGGFRVKPEQLEWSTMQAVQYFSTEPAGFVWQAKIALFSGLSVEVIDSLMTGEGSMKGRVAAVFTFMDVQGRRELNEAAMQRYLAEAVWFPTALLPSQGVQWTAIDEHKALATLTQSGLSVSLEFEFSPRGEALSVFSPGRCREVSGHFIPTPWRGSFSDYKRVAGYLIPQQAEVAWQLKDGIYRYWQARLIDINYQ